MEQTTHFNLNKPEGTDPVDIDDLNENADIIDAALNDLDTAIYASRERTAITPKPLCYFSVTAAGFNQTDNKCNPKDLTFPRNAWAYASVGYWDLETGFSDMPVTFSGSLRIEKIAFTSSLNQNIPHNIYRFTDITGNDVICIVDSSNNNHYNFFHNEDRYMRSRLVTEFKDLTDNSLDFNDVNKEGAYSIDYSSYSEVKHSPTNDYNCLTLFTFQTSYSYPDTRFLVQISGRAGQANCDWFIRSCDVGGNWTAWKKLTGGTVNTYNNTTNITQQNNSYTVNADVDITTDSLYYLAPTGDNSDRTSAIQSLLNTNGICRLGAGDYYVTGISIPDFGKLEGVGNKTKIILDTSVTDGFAIKFNGNYGKISNLYVYGGSSAPSTSGILGTRQGVVYESNYVDFEEAGTLFKQNKIESVKIYGFNGAGIYCLNTGGSQYSGITVQNCDIDYCGAGINIARFSEYNLFSDCRCNRCYYGCINNGGNNIFNNCNFSGNYIGALFDNHDGNAINNTHGSMTNCVFNHEGVMKGSAYNNKGIAIKMDNVTAGFVFTGCQLFYGSVELNDVIGVEFNGCLLNCATDTHINIINSQVEDADGIRDGLVLFNGCLFTVNPTGTVEHSTHTYFNNCYVKRTGSQVTRITS